VSERAKVTLGPEAQAAIDGMDPEEREIVYEALFEMASDPANFDPAHNPNVRPAGLRDVVFIYRRRPWVLPKAIIVQARLRRRWRRTA
jgi:hypothetical protein